MLADNLRVAKAELYSPRRDPLVLYTTYPLNVKELTKRICLRTGWLPDEFEFFLMDKKIDLNRGWDPRRIECTTVGMILTSDDLIWDEGTPKNSGIVKPWVLMDYRRIIPGRAPQMLLLP